MKINTTPNTETNLISRMRQFVASMLSAVEEADERGDFTESDLDLLWKTIQKAEADVWSVVESIEEQKANQ